MKTEFYSSDEYAEICSRFHMSQAVRVGNRVDTAGQGGWSGDFEYPQSLAEEVSNAFDNLGRVLALAGASWADVTKLTSYHRPTAPGRIGLAHQDPMADEMASRMPTHQPIWTCVGVPVLGEPEMRVEIRATAFVNDTQH